MADISTLAGLAPVEQLDLDNYAVNTRKSFQLPKRGVYTLQAPQAFPEGTFGVSRAGALTAQIDPTIVGPTNEGFTLRYIKVSGKVYKRDGQNVSQIGDYLKAVGVTGVFATPQDLADAVELTAGATYQAELDWRAYGANGLVDIEGQSNFPVDPVSGERQSWVAHPTEKNEDGTPKRVFANLFIRNFIAQ